MQKVKPIGGSIGDVLSPPENDVQISGASTHGLDPTTLARIEKSPYWCYFDTKMMFEQSAKKNGAIDPTSVNNAVIILVNDYKFRCCLAYDAFSHKATIIKPFPWEDKDRFQVRPIGQDDIVQVQMALEVHSIKLSTTSIMNAMHIAAKQLYIHPVREYFDRTLWDGVNRLDTWLAKYCGATEQDPAYVAAVGACFLKAAVARVYNPGCKFDHMMVLEGGQGIGKSTMLRTMATFGGRAYFSDRLTFDMLDHKSTAEFLAGNLIIEFQELTGLGKKDTNKVKQWITLCEDELQKKYENATTIYPRQFVLAGTTNQSQWLTDATGNRRFWPIKVSENIDIEGLKEAREQLWAEAVHRYKSGEIYYIPQEDPVHDITLLEQQERFSLDVWSDMILDFAERRSYVTVDDVLLECLKIDRGRWTNEDRNRVTAALRNGKYVTKSTRINGKVRNAWHKPTQKE